MENQRRQAFPRLAAERRGRVEPTADLRRIDAEQPHAADGRHIDRVAVDDRPDEHRTGPRDAAVHRGGLNGGNSRGGDSDQNLHRRLQFARGCADRNALVQEVHQPRRA